MTAPKPTDREALRALVEAQEETDTHPNGLCSEEDDLQRSCVHWERMSRALAAAREVLARPEPPETLAAQIDRLAAFIMSEIPGEPCQSEGAVDCAIRWMRGRLIGYPGLQSKPEELPEPEVVGFRCSNGHVRESCYWESAGKECSYHPAEGFSCRAPARPLRYADD